MRNPIMTVLMVLGLSCCINTAVATKLFVATGNPSWNTGTDGIAQFTTEEMSDYSMVYDDIQACSDGQWGDWYIKCTSLYYYAGHNKIMGYAPKKVSYDASYYFEHISWAKYDYDGNTFSQSLVVPKSIPGGPNTNEFAFPNMLTYNPVTEKIYGSNIDINYNTGEFATVIREVNPETGERGEESIRLPNVSINSLTTDARGVIYVTQSNGNLCTFNLESKEFNTVGNIGVYSNQTGWSCFDYATGKLYIIWGTDLYEIDVETPVATKLGSVAVPEGSLIRGLFCFGQPDPLAAPGAPTDIMVDFSAPGSREAVISAIAPLFYLDGKTDLDVGVTMKFYVDDGEDPVAEIENVAPGKKVSVPYTFTSDGNHTVLAVASNNKGESAPATIVRWAGYDIPLPPSGVNLTITDDGRFQAEWSAPAGGANGTDIDTKTLRYRAVLNPTGETFDDIAETSIAGVLSDGTYHAYYMTVEATADGKTSEKASSQTVCHGTAFEPAWMTDYSNPEEDRLFTVTDGNNDGTTWEFSTYFNRPCFIVNTWQSRNQMDEWLVTPPILMREGATYTVSFSAFSGIFDEQDGTLGVYAGSTPDIASMKQIASEKVTSGEEEVKSATYTADSDGQIFFAFHAGSSAEQSIMCLDYIAVEATPVAGAPAAASGIEVVPGDKGVLEATVSFTLPMLDNTGKPLSSISDVRILIDDSPKAVAHLTDATPGEKKSVTVDVAELGERKLSVICYNDRGLGEAASASKWIGEDRAGRVNNFNIKETDESYMVTWDAPDTSAHGMYVDFANLSYEVLVWLTGMDEPMTFASGLKETSCEIPYAELLRRVPGHKGQINVEIYVFPVSAAGYGDVAGAIMVYGDPYTLPFEESFARGSLSTEPWSTIEVGYDYQNAWVGFGEESAANPNHDIKASDGDGGMAAFYQTRLPFYSERLLSPRLMKDNGKKYDLSFYTYHFADAADDVILQAEANIGGTEFVNLGEPVAINKGNGWERHTVSLDAVPDGNFRISFRADAPAGMPVYLDGISISHSAGITSPEADAARIILLEGAVGISGTDADYAIWNAAGVTVASGKVNGCTIVSLMPGAYVVRAGESTLKCVVK